MKHVEDQWILFRKAVIHPMAPHIQVTECRKAFFAGAFSLYLKIMTTLNEGDEATPEDMTFLDEIYEEYKDYNRKIGEEARNAR